MPTVRAALLAATTLTAILIRPAWLAVDLSDPITWVLQSRPEDVAAAVLRLAVIALGSSQLVLLAAVVTARLTSAATLADSLDRLLLPALRLLAPVAVVAGTALPAAASGVSLPIRPPVTTTVDPAPTTVLVQPGDSMWTIAAERSPDDVAGYWRRVVSENRDRFVDVDLIHPGDTVVLPPVNPPG